MAPRLASPRLHVIVAAGGGLVFLGSLLYFVASYVWRFEPEPALSRGTFTPILVDLGLFTVFSLHHSIFARTPLKAWMHETLPPQLERSVYVWISSLLFIATCAWWQPVPGLAWRVGGTTRAALEAIQLVAAVFIVISARRLGVFQLAGLRQVLSGPSEVPVLDERGPYAIVRHPIYLGWLLVVWAAPTMNGTRLAFAAISSAYLALAIPFEERDLRAFFGPAYDHYRQRVRWRMVPLLY